MSNFSWTCLTPNLKFFHTFQLILMFIRWKISIRTQFWQLLNSLKTCRPIDLIILHIFFSIRVRQELSWAYLSDSCWFWKESLTKCYIICWCIIVIRICISPKCILKTSSNELHSGSIYPFSYCDKNWY